jgi:hypothetical protein
MFLAPTFLWTDKYLGEVDGLNAPLLVHLAEEDEFISKAAQAEINTVVPGSCCEWLRSPVVHPLIMSASLCAILVLSKGSMPTV